MMMLAHSTVVGRAAADSPAGSAAASQDAAPFYADTFQKRASADALTQLGRLLFNDAALSASGKISCASCHDPKRSFGPPNDLAVQRGGGDGHRSGVRAVPSLMYTQNVPPFSEHSVDDEGDDSVDQGPAGGRTWDGRAQSAHEQARLPLFSPFEMANVAVDDVVASVRRAVYAGQFRAAFGDNLFDSNAAAFKAILMALETYQQSPREFYPYSSKYDAWLRRQAQLSARELRGLQLFNDAAKGNCARCHPSAMRQGALPQFTDFGYVAIGVPRNLAIPANTDRRYFDLGLCGPLRTDLKDKAEYCGMFRTPSLRNVATRRVFFHNGAVHRLEDAVRFYAERDTHPERWYGRRRQGAANKFDDLPGQYQANVDVLPPFDRHPGEQAALSPADVADLVVFLQTLTDGYTPARQSGVNR
jgi:cytochrome c peroxidase